MKTGDLILIKSGGVNGYVNRGAQQICTFMSSNYTHVLLCIDEHVVIDATPKDGVMLRNIVREVIAGRLTSEMCKTGSMCVLRPPLVLWREEFHKLYDAVITCLGKDYNWYYLITQSSDSNFESEDSHSVFCSELVTLLLLRLGYLPEKWRRASKTLPVHFEGLFTQWKNVTNECSGELKKLEQLSVSPKQDDCLNLGRELYDGNFLIDQLETLKKMNNLSAATQKKIKKMRGTEKEIQLEFEKLRSLVNLIRETE